MRPTDRWIERRLMVIPLFADGMVAHEVADALGLTTACVQKWSERDDEIGWWCRAAYAARREVRSTGKTFAELRAGYNRKRKANALARTAANGGVSPVGTHGTCGCYENHGCRCEPCRAAKSDCNRRARARRALVGAS